MRIAMIGTRGVPARYGGFETAVEEIGARLAARGNRVVVYCRNPGQHDGTYRGMDLVNLPAIRLRSAETLSHSGLSAAHAIAARRADVALVFNAANAPHVPALRLAGIPVAVHLDGLEWERAKWTGAGARYFRWAARRSAEWADELVVDSLAVGAVVRSSFGRTPTYIPYGAPLVHLSTRPLAAMGLRPNGFHLVVARLEPENHVVEIIEGFRSSGARLPLVVVGHTTYSREYAARATAAAAGDDRIRFIGPVWDQRSLDALYAGALTYLHGHSVGGTNPSLLRAMGAGTRPTVYDCPFNREVVGEDARLFVGAEDVRAAVEADEAKPEDVVEAGLKAQAHATATYRWDDVAEAYEELAVRLASRRGATRAALLGRGRPTAGAAPSR